MIEASTSLPSASPLQMPRFGLGTWRIGERDSQRQTEVAALRGAIGLGYRLIDTAEMYGEGGSERVIGEALAQAVAAGEVERRQMYIVSKVYPQHATRMGVANACQRTLQRLGMVYLDLYLLHWRGEHPLGETIAGFDSLIERGLIRRWGVSNFDTSDLAELVSLPGGRQCAVNQIYFSLGERGAAFSLLPWMRDHGMLAMAYSPIDQGALASSATLQPIADRLGCSRAQLALAWVLAQTGMVAIAKAVDAQHLRDNIRAGDIQFQPADLAEIDLAFPAPRRKKPLAMI